MNVLWITNIALPPVCEALGWNKPAVGGWLYSSLKRMALCRDDKYAVATIYAGRELIVREVNGIRFYMLPLRGCSASAYNKHFELIWRHIQNEFSPDIVHIHGSEFPHGLAYVRSCGADGVIVSVQGILSAYSRYYAVDGKKSSYLLTFRDILKGDSITRSRKAMEARGSLEIELFRCVKHVIGRTEWDKLHIWAINPKATYYYCGETLRDIFYRYTWKYTECIPHSIFVSQGNYPIKGLHKLFEAMPLVMRQYPDAKVYVGGADPTSLPWYRVSAYGLYLKRLIKHYSIEDHVRFLGMLDEEAICRQYLRSNVFVCPSAIENSPNSLGEAQLLGMPYVAAYVGGIPEIVENNPTVLYRYEEIEMLAAKICMVFEQKQSFMPNDYNRLRYDGEHNAALLCEIYQKIYKK